MIYYRVVLEGKELRSILLKFVKGERRDILICYIGLKYVYEFCV